MSSTPGEVGRLVAHDPHGSTVQPAKTHDYVRSEVLVDLQELFIVHDPANNVPHIVRPVGIIGHHVSQVGIGT